MGKKSRSFMTQRNNLLGGKRKITKRFFNLIKSIPVVLGWVVKLVEILTSKKS